MMYVTLTFLGCVAGAMATWWSPRYPATVRNMGTYRRGGHNMGTYTATGSHNMGTYPQNGNNMGTYTQYPNYQDSSFNSWYDSNRYQMNPSNQYSWNYPTSSLYGSDMSYNSMPVYTSSWNSDPYYTPQQYSWDAPTYMKTTYPKRTVTYKPTHPTYPPSIVGNTHTVNIGGGMRSGGISYKMNQGSYKPPMSKHHASW